MDPHRVYRVEWYPGSDRLLGTCHCSATLLAEDPIEIWQWLLAHPDGHLRADAHYDTDAAADHDASANPHPDAQPLVPA